MNDLVKVLEPFQSVTEKGFKNKKINKKYMLPKINIVTTEPILHTKCLKPEPSHQFYMSES